MTSPASSDASTTTTAPAVVVPDRAALEGLEATWSQRENFGAIEISSSGSTGSTGSERSEESA